MAEDGSGDILSDGENTKGLAAREKLLAAGRKGDTAKALKSEDVMNMRTEDGKALFRDHHIVYVYHNRIDAIGDKLQTEDKLPEAAEDAIEDLTKLVRKLTSANFSNMLTEWSILYGTITSHHRSSDAISAELHCPFRWRH